MFLEQQISILEWYLKDHVTLKTGEMCARLCVLTLDWLILAYYCQRSISKTSCRPSLPLIDLYCVNTHTHMLTHTLLTGGLVRAILH